jgi:hypothetical protein
MKGPTCDHAARSEVVDSQSDWELGQGVDQELEHSEKAQDSGPYVETMRCFDSRYAKRSPISDRTDICEGAEPPEHVGSQPSPVSNLGSGYAIPSRSHSLSLGQNPN